MSQGDKQKQKQNTDAWKLKQQEKKKKKQLQSLASTQITQKQQPKNEKVEKKKQKENKNKKNEQKKQKQVVVQDKIQQKPIVNQKIKKSQLKKIDNFLSQKLKQSRIYKQDLILKYVQKQIKSHDTILYIGDRQWTPSCQYVYVIGLNNCTKGQLVCRYSDIMYFLQKTITKIFIQADFIFANGSILAKNGSLNIALIGKRLNIPVIAVGGSWNYCKWSPLSYEAIQDRYGVQDNYDWIENKYLKTTITQINQKLNSSDLSIIYNIKMDSLEW